MIIKGTTYENKRRGRKWLPPPAKPTAASEEQVWEHVESGMSIPAFAIAQTTHELRPTGTAHIPPPRRSEFSEAGFEFLHDASGSPRGSRRTSAAPSSHLGQAANIGEFLNAPADSPRTRSPHRRGELEAIGGVYAHEQLHDGDGSGSGGGGDGGSPKAQGKHMSAHATGELERYGGGVAGYLRATANAPPSLSVSVSSPQGDSRRSSRAVSPRAGAGAGTHSRIEATEAGFMPTIEERTSTRKMNDTHMQLMAGGELSATGIADWIHGDETAGAAAAAARAAEAAAAAAAATTPPAPVPILPDDGTAQPITYTRSSGAGRGGTGAAAAAAAAAHNVSPGVSAALTRLQRGQLATTAASLGAFVMQHPAPPPPRQGAERAGSPRGAGGTRPLDNLGPGGLSAYMMAPPPSPPAAPASVSAAASSPAKGASRGYLSHKPRGSLNTQRSSGEGAAAALSSYAASTIPAPAESPRGRKRVVAPGSATATAAATAAAAPAATAAAAPASPARPPVVTVADRARAAASAASPAMPIPSPATHGHGGFGHGHGHGHGHGSGPVASRPFDISSLLRDIAAEEAEAAAAAASASTAAASVEVSEDAKRLARIRKALRDLLPKRTDAATLLLRKRFRARDSDKDGVVREDEVVKTLLDLAPSGGDGAIAGSDIQFLARAVRNYVPRLEGVALPGSTDIGVEAAAVISWLLAQPGGYAGNGDHDRLDFTSSSHAWSTFRAGWESRHGTGAVKEMASDAAQPAEGPTWTRAAPSPFKVLHLAGGAPSTSSDASA